MAGSWDRRFRRSVALLACLVCTAALPAGSGTAEPVDAAAASGAGGRAARPPVRVLQMNLCNSGMARCHTGRSVDEAGAVIRENAPDVVTLNEVCESDVDGLGEVMAGVHAGEVVVRAFKAAGDRRTGDATRCLNGERYGNALLVRVPGLYRGHVIQRGIYPTQDPLDPEERAWLCVYAAGAFYACTTHLSYLTRTVPPAQCAHLLGTVIPDFQARGGYAPTVLGGDLNLRATSPALRRCLPAGYLLEDDGSVQHIVASTDYFVQSSTVIDMAGTTDHPGLLVTLAPVAPPPPG